MDTKKSWGEGTWRYPGPSSFGDTRIDAALFRGRKSEVRSLLANVLFSPIVILYGASGSGKTSLLRAGLFPKLKEYRYWIAHLRGDDLRFSSKNGYLNNTRLLNKLINDYFSASNTARYQCVQKEDLKSKSWLNFYDEATIIELGQREVLPILLIDDFEEFILGDESDDEKLKVLSDIISLANGFEFESSENQANSIRRSVKVVISLEQGGLWNLDRLASKLRGYNPPKFFLEPLTHKAAWDALRLPGKLKCQFNSPRISYTKVELTIKKHVFPAIRSDSDSQLIDPFLLQLFSRHIETLARDKFPLFSEKDVYEVEESDLPLETNSAEFRLNAFESIYKYAQDRRVLKDLMKLLISENGNRKLLDATEIASDIKRSNAKDSLVSAGLLKNIAFADGTYLFISHKKVASDWIIFLQNHQARVSQQKKKKKIIFAWLAICLANVIIISVICGYLLELAYPELFYIHNLKKMVMENKISPPDMISINKLEPPGNNNYFPDLKGVCELNNSQPFAISKTEVTIFDYDVYLIDKAIKSNQVITSKTLLNLPGVPFMEKIRRITPAFSINYRDATNFADWLSSQQSSIKVGQKFRLPTEAEWISAAKFSDRKFDFDTSIPLTERKRLFEYVKLSSNLEANWIAPVCSKSGSGNLCDIFGNLWEWTQECHDVPACPKSNYDQAYVNNSAQCNKGILKGAGFLDSMNFVFPSSRFEMDRDTSNILIGFRLVSTKQ